MIAGLPSRLGELVLALIADGFLWNNEVALKCGIKRDTHNYEPEKCTSNDYMLTVALKAVWHACMAIIGRKTGVSPYDDDDDEKAVELK